MFILILIYTTSLSFWRKLSLLSLKIGRRSNIAFGPALPTLFLSTDTPSLVWAFERACPWHERTINSTKSASRIYHIILSFACSENCMKMKKKWRKIQSFEYSYIGEIWLVWYKNTCVLSFNFNYNLNISIFKPFLDKDKKTFVLFK